MGCAMWLIEQGIPTGRVGSIPLALAFSPDGRRLAVQSPAHGLAVLEPPSLTPVAVRHFLTAWCGVAFTAEGRVVWSEKGEMRVYDPERQGEPETLPDSKGCSGVGVSPDGATVYAGVRDGKATTIRRWDARTGQAEDVVGTKKAIHGVAVSRDGGWLAGFDEQAVRVWRLEGPTAQEKFVRRTRQFNAPRTVAISADGRLVAATGGGRLRSHPPLYLWDTATAKEPFPLDHPGSHAGGVAFHPTRPILASVGDEGSAVFWDLEGGRELKRFAWPTKGLHAVAFDPHGMRCAAAGMGCVVVWDVEE